MQQAYRSGWETKTTFIDRATAQSAAQLLQNRIEYIDTKEISVEKLCNQHSTWDPKILKGDERLKFEFLSISPLSVELNIYSQTPKQLIKPIQFGAIASAFVNSNNVHYSPRAILPTILENNDETLENAPNNIEDTIAIVKANKKLFGRQVIQYYLDLHTLAETLGIGAISK